MSLSVSEWVKTHPLYINAIKERDDLQVEVDHLRLAFKGAAHAQRVESCLLDSDISRLRDEQESQRQEIEELRMEKAALGRELAQRQSILDSLDKELEVASKENTALETKLELAVKPSPKVTAVG